MSEPKKYSSARALELLSCCLAAALVVWYVFGSAFAEPALADEPLQVVEALCFDSLLGTFHPDNSPGSDKEATDAPFRYRVQLFSCSSAEVSLGSASHRLRLVRLTPPTGPPHLPC